MAQTSFPSDLVEPLVVPQVSNEPNANVFFSSLIPTWAKKLKFVNKAQAEIHLNFGMPRDYHSLLPLPLGYHIMLCLCSLFPRSSPNSDPILPLRVGLLSTEFLLRRVDCKELSMVIFVVYPKSLPSVVESFWRDHEDSPANLFADLFQLSYVHVNIPVFYFSNSHFPVACKYVCQCSGPLPVPFPRLSLAHLMGVGPISTILIV